jgi:transcriptional regulator with XRE-family HTH domain
VAGQPVSELGFRIAKARRAAGLTQKALADAIGVSLGIFNRYETGAADPQRHLMPIAAATGKSLAWLVGSETERAHEAERLENDRRAALIADIDARHGELGKQLERLSKLEQRLIAREGDFALREREAQRKLSEREARLADLETKLEGRESELSEAHDAHVRALADLAAREASLADRAQGLATEQRSLDAFRAEVGRDSERVAAERLVLVKESAAIAVRAPALERAEKRIRQGLRALQERRTRLEERETENEALEAALAAECRRLNQAGHTTSELVRTEPVTRSGRRRG